MTTCHRVCDYVTCRLTAKKPGSAPCPELVIEYGNTYCSLMGVCMPNVLKRQVIRANFTPDVDFSLVFDRL